MSNFKVPKSLVFLGKNKEFRKPVVAMNGKRRFRLQLEATCIWGEDKEKKKQKKKRRSEYERNTDDEKKKRVFSNKLFKMSSK